MDYIEISKRLENKALSLRGNEDSWKFLKKVGDIAVYSKPSPDFKGSAYKFVTTICGPQDVVYGVMKPPTTTAERLSWDKSIDHYERLETINENLSVGLILTHPAFRGMISPREFVDLYSFVTFPEDLSNRNYGKTSWIFAQSVEHHKRKTSNDFVRATNYPAGFMVAEERSDPSNKSILEFYVNTDIGGMLPRYIVESALPSQQANYIESIKKEVARRMAKN